MLCRRGCRLQPAIVGPEEDSVVIKQRGVLPKAVQHCKVGASGVEFAHSTQSIRVAVLCGAVEIAGRVENERRIGLAATGSVEAMRDRVIVAVVKVAVCACMEWVRATPASSTATKHRVSCPGILREVE